MLNVVIIDDEKPAVDVLKLLLEGTGEVRIIDSFTSAVQALPKICMLKPDVVFLDIEMPEMTGLELAEKIIEENNDIEIVFVTAYDKYALEAFRVNAIDYILKPLSSEDISKVITRLKKIKPQQSFSKELTDKSRIYCFERLLVYGAGSERLVKWRTAKTEELFAFMLQNLNKEISKLKIIQALWPEIATDKSNVHLHTTIYRIKKTLISANIKFEITFTNGRYMLKLPEVYIDTVEFEAITNDENTLTEASIESYKRALSLYKGRYLMENEYLWTQGKEEEYEIRYRRVVGEYTKYYISKADYLKAEKILQQALSISPTDDELNELLMKLYLLKKDKASMIMHYNKIDKIYDTELGIEPNANIRTLFNNACDL